MKLSLKRVLAGLALTTLGFSATLLAQTATAPATQPDNPVLANINNQAIDGKKFRDLLMAVNGLRMFEQVASLVVVEQACKDAGFNVDAAEFNTKYVQAEIDRALADLGAQGVPKENREAALSQLLQRQGITSIEFQMAMRRAACLRLLSKGKVTPTDEQVDNTFAIEFGEKAIGRIVVVQDLPAGTEVRRLIESGKDPAELAGKANVSNAVFPKRADLVRPELKILQELAFQIKPKVLSAYTILGTNQAAFYLDKIEPANPPKAQDVAKEKARIKDLLTEQGERQWANQHLNNLLARAKIEINDPILSAQYADIARRIQAAASQNATQPSTGPKPK